MSAPARSLRIEALRFAYPDEPPLFDGWSTTLDAGVVHAFGDTGSGKSTLLRVLAGLEAAAGELTLAGAALSIDPDAYRARVCWFDAGDPEHDRSIAADLVGAAGAVHAEGFGLGPHLHKPLYMLSTGSRRKVFLAAALASGCPLILLDEPTGGLDAPSRAYLMRTLAALDAARARIVIVASSEPLAAASRTIALPLRGARQGARQGE